MKKNVTLLHKEETFQCGKFFVCAMESGKKKDFSHELGIMLCD